MEYNTYYFECAESIHMKWVRYELEVDYEENAIIPFHLYESAEQQVRHFSFHFLLKGEDFGFNLTKKYIFFFCYLQNGNFVKFYFFPIN